jgi:hypothetical protein
MLHQAPFFNELDTISPVLSYKHALASCLKPQPPAEMLSHSPEVKCNKDLSNAIHSSSPARCAGKEIGPG